MQEREALGRSLSQTLKDPDAAKFKWMPVIIAKTDGEIGYCGLVNGKNSYGGYIGFRMFYAVLTHNAKGEYTTGVIKEIGRDPTAMFRDENTLVTDAVTGANCDRWGYDDFSNAN